MIRQAVKNDANAVHGLIRQLSGSKFSKEQFDDCFFHNLEKKCILVYEKENTVCGCLVFDMQYLLHFSRKTAEIIDLVVDENSRSCGIGKALLTEFEKIARENGCVCIELASGTHREAAHRFYKREGFTCVHYKFRKELTE